MDNNNIKMEGIKLNKLTSIKQKWELIYCQLQSVTLKRQSVTHLYQFNKFNAILLANNHEKF
jgi:hypothetical protein